MSNEIKNEAKNTILTVSSLDQLTLVRLKHAAALFSSFSARLKHAIALFKSFSATCSRDCVVSFKDDTELHAHNSTSLKVNINKELLFLKEMIM